MSLTSFEMWAALSARFAIWMRRNQRKSEGGDENGSGRNEIRADGSTPIPVNPLPDLFALRIAIKFTFEAVAEKRRILRMVEHVSSVSHCICFWWKSKKKKRERTEK